MFLMLVPLKMRAESNAISESWLSIAQAKGRSAFFLSNRCYTTIVRPAVQKHDFISKAFLGTTLAVLGRNVIKEFQQ